MQFLEKELEDLIFKSFKNPKERQKLINKGLSLFYGYDLAFKQVDLGSYGRLDMCFVKYFHNEDWRIHKNLKILIMEIKKDEINIDSYLQAIRYCKGVEQMFKHTPINVTFEICLLGSSICTSEFCYLPDFVENLYLYTIRLDLEKGINFRRECRYSIPDAYLPNNNSYKKVISKYIKGEIYNKVHNVKSEQDGVPF